jgi:hypothetical protein
MLTLEQNATIYLMFLNGLLFMGLNFIARSTLYPGPSGSKRIGYVLIVSALLVFLLQEEYTTLLSLNFPPEKIREVLLGGFCAPVFFISLLFYRLRRGIRENKSAEKLYKDEDVNEDR